MIEIDNRKIDLTPELYAQLGEPKRTPDGSEMAVITRGGKEVFRGAVADAYRHEDGFRQNARLLGGTHEMFLMFENGRVEI